MANSKSNIYPIQLQGAELNLNKFDAEIKQYSGFNKNNAPFVGGCLSNIFTKNETIEGAGKDSVYIAPNGDVYQVKTDGLYKNNEKIIDYTGKDFFDVEEETNIPKNAVFVHDENNFIYYKNDIDYVLSINGEEFNLFNQFEVRNPEIVFAKDFHIYKKTIEGNVYTFVAVFVRGFFEPGELYPEDSKCYELIKVFKTDAEGTEFINYVFFEVVSSSEVYTMTSPILQFKGALLSNFYIAVLGNNRQNQCGIYSFNGSSFSYISSCSISDSSHSSSDEKQYYFSNKKVYWLGTFSSRSMRVKGDYVINYTNHVITITWDNDGEVDYSIPGTPSYGGVNLNDYYNIFKEWGVLFAFLWGSSRIGICDFVHDFGTLVNDDNNNLCRHLIGGIMNDTVLTNNGVATGLCLPGGIVLATEWNSIDIDFIFFGENTDTWKENNYYCLWKNINTDKWYKLVKTITPKIRLCNNQLVINVNSLDNSFEIQKQKKLLFAPAWNNRALKCYSFHNFSNDTVFIATSINEYSQENNPSILLNPISVNITDPFNYDITITERNFDRLVNVYLSKPTTPTEIIYRGSINLRDAYQNAYFIRSLENLPFPSDTNGNVAYSPSLFAEFFSSFGNDVFVKEGSNVYQLSKYNNQPVMSFYLGTLVEGLEDVFVLQGQYYGVINNQIFALQFYNGVVSSQTSVVSVQGLQFCGNTPYEALFYSKTNRCLYSFIGANVLNSKQFVDKLSVVKGYKYNPATQSIFLLTDIGVIVYSLFGIYLIDMPEAESMFILNNGVVLTDNAGNYRYVRYYKEDAEDDFLKENIKLETMFYGMNNETVTINDCLYVRLFSEEHEEGDLEVSATTLSLKGRMTEKTTFKIKASDWDEETHSIYLRYQPKEQRGLGISFKIESPFKIASLSVGSKADAILVDKVSKGAINSPQRTSNNTEW